MAGTEQSVSQTLWYDRSAAQGRLIFTGRDRIDLVHRMSTNDLTNMQQGQGRATVLTTALARIIDRLIVLERGETALMLAGQPEIVRNWLQRHIFWQDQVKIRDASAELGQGEIHGPQAAALAEQIAPGAASLPMHHFIERDGLIVARTFALDTDGFALIAPPEMLADLRGRAMRDVPEGSAAQYEQLRIEAGLPASGHELTEDYIPLEAGLWDAVSFSKGCYIGQEIIARMESRNKLAKVLVRLRLDGPAAEGAALRSDGAEIGTLTSVAGQAALGFVKPEFATPGTALIAGEVAAVVQGAVGGREA